MKKIIIMIMFMFSIVMIGCDDTTVYDPTIDDGPVTNADGNHLPPEPPEQL